MSRIEKDLFIFIVLFIAFMCLVCVSWTINLLATRQSQLTEQVQEIRQELEMEETK